MTLLYNFNRKCNFVTHSLGVRWKCKSKLYEMYLDFLLPSSCEAVGKKQIWWVRTFEDTIMGIIPGKLFTAG